MVKDKCSIVLTLESSPLAQFADIIEDDNKTAKDFWDAVVQIYKASNAQVIIKLEQELEALRLDDNGNWETNIGKFLDILGKLSTYDSPVKEEEKASKLLRTLPDSFHPLAMASQTNEYPVEKIISAVKGEFSRRRHTSGNKN